MAEHAQHLRRAFADRSAAVARERERWTKPSAESVFSSSSHRGEQRAPRLRQLPGRQEEAGPAAAGAARSVGWLVTSDLTVTARRPLKVRRKERKKGGEPAMKCGSVAPGCRLTPPPPPPPPPKGLKKMFLFFYCHVCFVCKKHRKYQQIKSEVLLSEWLVFLQVAHCLTASLTYVCV